MDNSETYFVGINIDRKKALGVIPFLKNVLNKNIVDQPLLRLSSFETNFRFVIEEFADMLCNNTQNKILFNLKVFNIIEEKFKENLSNNRTKEAVEYINKNIMKKYNSNIKKEWLKNNPITKIKSSKMLNMKNAYNQN